MRLGKLGRGAHIEDDDGAVGDETGEGLGIGVTVGALTAGGGETDGGKEDGDDLFHVVMVIGL